MPSGIPLADFELVSMARIARSGRSKSARGIPDLSVPASGMCSDPILWIVETTEITATLRRGDFIRISSHGGCFNHGRSDLTFNH
jgi:hypothetical protein